MPAAATFVTRRAVSADAAGACDVVRRSITELCVDDHRHDEATLAAWLANKTAPDFESWIVSAQHIAIVAEADGRVAGFALLNRDGRLARLYVAPERKLRGVSKARLAAIESEAIGIGLRPLTLSSSCTARRFYLRCGFTVAGAPENGLGVTQCHPLAKRLTP